MLSAGSYQARVIAGDYDVVYAVTQTDDVAVPRNAGAVVAQISVEADPVVDIDVPTVLLTGAVTIDGAAPPMMGDGGVLRLRDAGTGETFELAPGVILVGGAVPASDALGELRLEPATTATSGFPLADVADADYAVRVTPGSYIVRYAVVDYVGVPANTNAALACIVVP